MLLDFWATWYPPYREEVPNIVAVYNQYHPRGFEILGVSLDRANQLNTLRQFMGQFGMSWAQIYDGGYWKAEVAQQFGVNSIPHAILVDGTTGKILAMGDDLRGSGLQNQSSSSACQRPVVASLVSMHVECILTVLCFKKGVGRGAARFWGGPYGPPQKSVQCLKC